MLCSSFTAHDKKKIVWLMGGTKIYMCIVQGICMVGTKLLSKTCWINNSNTPLCLQQIKKQHDNGPRGHRCQCRRMCSFVASPGRLRDSFCSNTVPSSVLSFLSPL
ncbi:hypothetical protein V6N12_035996 [Hibiscus sabdariffa]|uniref:Uncharacterized protein n=1 Tax=Hibiscus sabdariffa TaxID=183260 RepID=A0ABR2EPB9_9ROSI